MQAAEKLVQQYSGLRDASRAFKPSAEQIEALQDYTKIGYIIANRALDSRKNEEINLSELAGAASSDVVQAKHMSVAGMRELVKIADRRTLRNITLIDSTLIAAPKTTDANTLVFRGVRDDLAESVTNMKAGDSMTIHGFLSTSLDPSVSRNFFQFSQKGCLMIIAVPRGTPYVIVDHVVAKDELWELEVLMARGAMLTARWTQDLPDFSVRRLLRRNMTADGTAGRGKEGHGKEGRGKDEHGKRGEGEGYKDDGTRAKSVVRGKIKVVYLELTGFEPRPIPESTFPMEGPRIVIQPWHLNDD